MDDGNHLIQGFVVSDNLITLASMNCSKHKSEVGGIPNTELAKQIGDLRYDALIELFNALSKKFESDSEADRERGRTQLANHLLSISIKFKNMEIEMSEIWKICEPYMKKDNNE